jgi:flagellar secretion chaperone FliS
LNVNPLNAYRETKIKTASQGKIIVMLYDEAIKQLDTAIAGLEKKTKQLDLVHNSVSKAQDIVTELIVSLDFDRGGEIAKNLFNLYMFFNRQMLEGNVNKDTKILSEVRGLMSELRDAWVEIARKHGDTQAGTVGVNLAG